MVAEEESKDGQEVVEELQGMESEAKLLAGFLDIPTVSKGWFLPGGRDSTTLTVRPALHMR